MNVDLNFELYLRSRSIQGGPMEIGASLNDEAKRHVEINLKFDDCYSSNKTTFQYIKTDILFKNSGKDINRVIFLCDYYNRQSGRKLC